MEARDKAADLNRRIEDFSRDPLMRVVYWCWPLLLTLIFIPDQHEPWWTKPLLGSFFVPLFWAILRHRFYLSAFGLFICLGGAGLSVWYVITGTKRPSWDEYTGFLLLTGIVLVGFDILINWIRLRAWEREVVGPSSDAAL